jgi:hypothetical protein
MLSKRLNPFAAILALTVIASVGTLFVVHQIFETDFTYAAQEAALNGAQARAGS